MIDSEKELNFIFNWSLAAKIQANISQTYFTFIYKTNSQQRLDYSQVQLILPKTWVLNQKHFWALCYLEELWDYSFNEEK